MRSDGGGPEMGFAGFRAMVTDISPELELAERLYQRTLVTPTPAGNSTGDLASPRPPSSRANWPLILAVGGGIAAILLWIVASNNASYDTSPTYAETIPAAESAYPTTEAPPADAVAPAEFADAAPSPSIQEEGELKPPIGRGIALNRNQIEYCLAERIRIEASEPYVASESQNYVTTFNAFVQDYNDRCSDYLYRESDMSVARTSVGSRRSALEEEGRARFP